MSAQPPTRERKTRIRAGTSSPPPKIEYVYHWDRIIGAFVLLVLLIGLLGFALRAWVSSSSKPGDGDFITGEAPVAQMEVAPGPAEQDGGAAANESDEPEVATVPDTVMRNEMASPVDEDGLAKSEVPEITGEDLPPVFLSPGTRVNLRAAPSLASPVLRILDNDAELRLLEIGALFHQVRTADGIAGWVSRDFSSLTPYAAPTP